MPLHRQTLHGDHKTCQLSNFNIRNTSPNTSINVDLIVMATGVFLIVDTPAVLLSCGLYATHGICACVHCIRRHGSDVYLGMCPIKMATPILMYYGASAKLAKRRRRRTIEGYG